MSAILAVCLCHRYTIQIAIAGVAVVCATPLAWRLIRGRSRGPTRG